MLTSLSYHTIFSQEQIYNMLHIAFVSLVLLIRTLAVDTNSSDSSVYIDDDRCCTPFVPLKPLSVATPEAQEDMDYHLCRPNEYEGHRPHHPVLQSRHSPILFTPAAPQPPVIIPSIRIPTSSISRSLRPLPGSSRNPIIIDDGPSPVLSSHPPTPPVPIR